MYRIIGYEGNEDPAAPAPYTFGAAAVHDTRTYTVINAVTGSATRYHGGPIKGVFMLPSVLYVDQYQGCYVARLRSDADERALWAPMYGVALDLCTSDGTVYVAVKDLATLQVAASVVASNLLKFGREPDAARIALLLTLDHESPEVNAAWVRYNPQAKKAALANVGEAGRDELLRLLGEGS